jgi:hypothetical protein
MNDLIERLPKGYTPGPWDVLSGDPYHIRKNLPCINGLSAWFTLAWVYPPDDQEIGYSDGALDDNVAKANATLIALAPEMAEELARVTAERDKLQQHANQMRGVLEECEAYFGGLEPGKDWLNPTLLDKISEVLEDVPAD